MLCLSLNCGCFLFSAFIFWIIINGKFKPLPHLQKMHVCLLNHEQCLYSAIQFCFSLFLLCLQTLRQHTIATIKTIRMIEKYFAFLWMFFSIPCTSPRLWKSNKFLESEIQEWVNLHTVFLSIVPRSLQSPEIVKYTNG